MSTITCQTCQRTIASVVRLRDNRERIKLDLTVLSATAPRVQSNQPVLVDVIFNSPGSTRYDAAGWVIAREPMLVKEADVMELTWTTAGWRIVEISDP